MKSKSFIIFLVMLLILVGVLGSYIVHIMATKDMVIHAKIFVENKEYELGDNVTFYLKADTYSYDFDIRGDYPLGNVGLGIFPLPKGMSIDDFSKNNMDILTLEKKNHGVVCFHWTNKMGDLRLFWNGTVLNVTEGKYYEAQSGYYFIYPLSYAYPSGGHIVQFIFSNSSIFYFKSVLITVKKISSAFMINITSPFSSKGELSAKVFFENGVISYINRSVELSPNNTYSIKYTPLNRVDSIIVTLKISIGEFQEWWGK